MHQRVFSRLRCPFAILLVFSMLLVLIPSLPAHAQAASIGTGICTASSLAVRSGPSTSYTKLGSIKKGVQVVIYDERNGWYQIAYQNGYGWVSGSYIRYTATGTADAIGQGIVSTGGGSLNVRSGPGTGYAKIGSLAYRASVPIYAEQSGWYRIVFSAQTGWVSADYVTFSAATPHPDATPTPSVSPSPTPSQTPAPSVTPTPSPSVQPSGSIGTAKVTVSTSLNVRQGPGTSYASIGKVYNGNVLTVYSVRTGWVELDFNGRHGWVSSQYVEVTLAEQEPDDPEDPPSDPPADAIGTGVCNVSTTLNVRSGPSTSSGIVGKLSNGNNVYILAVSNSWYQIEYQGLIGWCSASYISANFSDGVSRDPIVEAVYAYTYEQMQSDIAALHARYPDKIAVSSIGTSVEGRDLPVLIIGDSNATHQILIHAGIHGREHMNANLVMMQVEYMLANPDTVYAGRTFAQWMSDVAFHIVPMVNPDGIAISQTQSGSDNILAICALNLVGTSDLPAYLLRWKANANGVDLNLQFPSGWNEKESASLPAGIEYKGEAPFTQTEALALKAYTLSHSFDITISYHSTGSTIYVEFPLASSRTNALSRSLGQTVGAMAGYTIRGTLLTEGAGYKDWALTECGIPSITIETGTTSCPLPLSQFAGIWARNKYLWPVLVKWVEENTD